MEFTFNIKSSIYASAFCLRALSCLLSFSFASSLVFLSVLPISLSHFFIFFFLSALLSTCTCGSQLCPLQSHFIVTGLLHLLGVCKLANIPFVTGGRQNKPTNMGTVSENKNTNEKVIKEKIFLVLT